MVTTTATSVASFEDNGEGERDGAEAVVAAAKDEEGGVVIERDVEGERKK